MKRIFRSAALALCLLLALTLTACGKPKNQVNISLIGNALTGYTWYCTSDGDGVVEELSSKYVSGDTFCSVGANGHFVFLYGPVSEGAAVMEYEYRRDKPGEEPLYTAAYRLIVDGEGLISYEVVQEPTYDYTDEDRMP